MVILVQDIYLFLVLPLKYKIYSHCKKLLNKFLSTNAYKLKLENKLRLSQLKVTISLGLT